MTMMVPMFALLFMFLSGCPPLLVLARPTNLGSTLVRRRYDPSDPQLPPAVQTVCPGGVNSTVVDDLIKFGPDGSITLTIGSCPPTNSTTTTTSTSTSSNDESSTSGSGSLSSRQFCRTAPNDCVARFGTLFQSSGFVSKCGAQCTSSCYPGNNGPDPNHCEHIIAAFANEQAQLFSLAIVTQYYLFTYQTCGIGIHNTIAASTNGCSRTMVYDYVDLGAVARYLAWSCQGAQNAMGGRCTGVTGIYDPKVPDFYIDVYRN